MGFVGAQGTSGHRRSFSTHLSSSQNLSASLPENSAVSSQPFETKRKRPEAVLACLSYAGCSTLLTLANKAIFSETRLNYPWMLLGVQSVVVTLMLLVYYAATTDGKLLIQAELLRQMFLPCTFFTLFIFTNACALRHISLPVLTVVKSLAPMGIALAERALFGERVSLATYGAMAMILSGNAVTVLHDIEFNARGYTWSGLNVLMNVGYVVSLRYCLSDKFSSGMKTLHSNILACTFIFPLAMMSGETPGFYIEFGQTSLRFRMLFLLSCVLAAGIGASVFWVIRTASGSTLSFVGASNKVFVVILGAVLFEAKISPAGWVGVGMGTLAGLLFAVAKASAGKEKGVAEVGVAREEKGVEDGDERDEIRVELRKQGAEDGDENDGNR